MPFKNFSSKMTFEEISMAISKHQLKEGLRSEGKDYFHEIRLKLSDIGKLDFYCESDTFFLLESYDIENANFYGKIWNNKSMIAFTYNQGRFNYDDVGAYTKYTSQLIQSWNIGAIRHEEETNSTMTVPLIIYGSRVIKTEGNVKIDCVRFKEFFLLERDR